MNTKADVEDFVAQRKLAVVGVSRKKQKFGSVVFRELLKREYTVYPINPNTDNVDGTPCYPDLKSLPEPVDGVVMVAPPASTEQAVRDAKDAGITRVWMQQGSQSDDAVNYCKENGMTVVANECILMFVDPVTSIHKFHHWLWKVFGKLPK